MDPDLCKILEATVDTETMIFGMPTWACWVVIAVLLLVSGLFSASENAFSNCNRYHFQALAEKGSLTAKLVCRLVDKFDNTLVSVLVGNNIVQTFMSFLSAMLFYDLSKRYGLSSGIEAVLSTVVMAALVYIVSDTIPKILSKSLPNRMAIVLCYPVFVVSIPLYPAILLFRGLLFLAHKLFKTEDQNLLSKEELIDCTKQAVLESDGEEDSDEKEEAEPLFEKDETKIINNVFSFDEVSIKKVYTPLSKTFALNGENLSIEDINRAFIETNYSRIPIYDGSKENVVGVLVAKTYFEEYAKDSHLDFRSIMEPPLFLDAGTSLNKAFKSLNAELVHLALVQEEGKTIGIVSMEDILEELVEDIDEAHEGNLFRKKKGGKA